MTKLTRMLEVTAYRDDAGKPCCAMDFSIAEVCRFYRTTRFGCEETCVFMEDHGVFPRLERRGENECGTLIPCDTCPIWKEEPR